MHPAVALCSFLKGKLSCNEHSQGPAIRKQLELRDYMKKMKRQENDKVCVNGVSCWSKAFKVPELQRHRGEFSVWSFPSVLSFEGRGCFQSFTCELSVRQ